MNPIQRRPLLELLTKTRLGRMIMLAAGVSALLVLLSNGCSAWKKNASKGGAPAEAGAHASTPGDELPPRPHGFDESLPVAQQYKALVSSYGERVASTEKELQATRKELENVKLALQAAEGARRKDDDRLQGLIGQIRQAAGAQAGTTAQPAGERAAPGSAFRVLEFASTPPPGKNIRRLVHIPAATGGLATLMNGVFAPTTGEPSPVRLRFDAALLGPNKSRIPIRDTFLIGKATGDANSSRITIQVEKLAYVKENGEPVEARVLGYVVGDDGLEGVPGTYEWRATEILPLAALAGGVSYGSDALAQRETTTSVTPLGGATNVVTGDPLKFAGFRAAAGASGKMGELLAERMREIRPAVSTSAHRRVHVVFLEGVTLEGLNVDEIDYGRDHDPFHGLDLHR